MNWLAHIALSKPCIDYQLGNLLADPLKGIPWHAASQNAVDGMKMHKSIDAYTDAHPVVMTSKSRLGRRRPLKGVVIDLLYDHFLSIHFESYFNMPLESFVKAFNHSALQASGQLPDDCKNMLRKIVQHNVLASYTEFSGFELALQRMDLRLSERLQKKDTAIGYLPLVEAQYEHLQKDFYAFFPDLINHFKSHHLGSLSEHYLIPCFIGK